MELLDLDDILKSYDVWEDYLVAELNGTVEIRRLTGVENDKLNTIRQKGVKVEMDAKFNFMRPKEYFNDMELTAKNNSEAEHVAVEMCMRLKGGKSVTREQLSKFPVGAVNSIAQEIFKRSGLGKEVEKILNSFRGDKEGASDV